MFGKWFVFAYVTCFGLTFQRSCENLAEAILIKYVYKSIRIQSNENLIYCMDF